MKIASTLFLIPVGLVDSPDNAITYLQKMYRHAYGEGHSWDPDRYWSGSVTPNEELLLSLIQDRFGPSGSWLPFQVDCGAYAYAFIWSGSNFPDGSTVI